MLRAPIGHREGPGFAPQGALPPGPELVFGGHRERFMTDKGPLPVNQGRNAWSSSCRNEVAGREGWYVLSSSFWEAFGEDWAVGRPMVRVRRPSPF